MENKADLSSALFLSFGFGPRNCLGMRLALVEIKLALIHMLREIKFTVCQETQVSLCLSVILYMSHGIQFTARLYMHSKKTQISLRIHAV